MGQDKLSYRWTAEDRASAVSHEAPVPSDGVVWALRPGATVAGRYRIERLLRTGGMGAVYVAVHLETARRRALKVLRPDIVTEPDERIRFQREARVGALIDSVHVVDVLDAGVDADTGMPFLVMELLSGQPLGELLRERGRLSPTEVLDLLGQIARALDKAHDAGIVHCDLKPANIFVCLGQDESPRIKLLDFGIAKMLHATSGRMTHGRGTPLFMAPEQTERGSQISPATDIWALGLIAYAALTGSSYWQASNLAALYREILFDEFERPSARAERVGVHLPPEFDGWMLRCLARAPADRFHRAGVAIESLVQALRSWSEQASSSPWGLDARTSSSPSERSRPPDTAATAPLIDSGVMPPSQPARWSGESETPPPSASPMGTRPLLGAVRWKLAAGAIVVLGLSSAWYGATHRQNQSERASASSASMSAASTPAASSGELDSATVIPVMTAAQSAWADTMPVGAASTSTSTMGASSPSPSSTLVIPRRVRPPTAPVAPVLKPVATPSTATQRTGGGKLREIE